MLETMWKAVAGAKPRRGLLDRYRAACRASRGEPGRCGCGAPAPAGSRECDECFTERSIW